MRPLAAARRAARVRVRGGFAQPSALAMILGVRWVLQVAVDGGAGDAELGGDLGDGVTAFAVSSSGPAVSAGGGGAGVHRVSRMFFRTSRFFATACLTWGPAIAAAALRAPVAVRWRVLTSRVVCWS